MRKNRFVPACLRLAVLAALGLSLIGCDTLNEFREKRYSRHNDKGEQWLSDQMSPSEINVTGEWKSEDWGKTSLYQNGRDIRGHLGDYPVKGVVSGNKAYLLVGSGGWYYYSAIVEMPGPNFLIGYYSRTVPYRSDSRSDLRLDREVY